MSRVDVDFRLVIFQEFPGRVFQVFFHEETGKTASVLWGANEDAGEGQSRSVFSEGKE